MNKCFFILTLTCPFIFNAQEKLGITNSNYSSTNSIYLNPSSSVDSKTYMQLNLIGINAFFFNNIAYLPSFSIGNLVKKGQVEYPKISSLKLKKFIYANAEVDGPAFIISKRNYGAGFFTRARTIVDIKRIPYELTNAFLKNNPYNNFSREGGVDLKNIKLSTMSWVEHGVNFGMIAKQDKNNFYAIGGNLKYLTGINIAYVNVSRIKATYNDSVAKIDEISGKLRYNIPAWNTGRGFGVDIGVTYKNMLKNIGSYMAHSVESNCTSIDYKFKAAISLRDLGFINFTGNTQKAEFYTSGDFRKKIDTTEKALKSALNLSFYTGNILAILPTNIVAQFDWNFENNIYLNGTIIKNLVPNTFTGVQSTNLISICPRVEFKKFEVAMPLTLQKFLYPQLGFAFRIRSFVLGFDNVFPLLFAKPKTYGASIYFNLAVSIFKNWACNQKQRAVYCPPKRMSGVGTKRKK